MGLEELLAKPEFVLAQFVKHLHRGDLEKARFYLELNCVGPARDQHNKLLKRGS